MSELIDRQTQFCGYLRSGFTGNLNLPGWSLKGACAVTGNATQENLVRPITTGVKDHGSDGVLQWRLERLTDLQTWATQNFGTWRTLQAQAAFTLYETARDYADLDAQLRSPGALTISYLATKFNRTFERSADNEAINAKRGEYATGLYNLLTNAPVPAAPSRAPAVVQSGALGVVIIAAVTGVWSNFVGGNLGPDALILIVGMIITAGAVYIFSKLPGRAAPQPSALPVPIPPLGAKPGTTDIDAMILRLDDLRAVAENAQSEVAAQVSLIKNAVVKGQAALDRENAQIMQYLPSPTNNSTKGI